ncbi:CidA/LrgA family protein [Flammeovirga yaeyamensis]|uniref:CidA/LrgA family protein n=1 Tax=Flammeovirga yaeyamensis TaxID=367791 RepID=A0AAX1NBM0_9BACT|nr:MULTISPECIES: CidA/LrgA family protein [Flammeovirga]MBB3698763.1 holin-like protein [Flammeovirga yaeyamensis]NMF37348.1 CidA/LrgA family protein [Flammeovirga yaeyamensis]QJD09412.1 CidA/LrgA family protein [Flammeovirga sp. MY04]QWG03836.1 CidA/LrgA family protein [Flammeovirga yaeyamensis]
MIRGFMLILAMLSIGTLINELTDLPIPGNVIGMIILFLCLQFKIIPYDWVKDAAASLTKRMSLFFIPAGVGMMEYLDLLKDNVMMISVTIVGSMFAVLLTAGWTGQFLGKKDQK